MTKVKIVTLSCLSALLLTIVILFSFVFCLYGEEVSFSEDLDLNAQEIIDAGGLKHGTPIFAINKDSAKANIEKAYPNVEVVSINTTSLRSIKYTIKKRVPIYYIETNEMSFILDKDLKILSLDETEPTNLIKLELEMPNNAKAGEFVLKQYMIFLIIARFIHPETMVIVLLLILPCKL